MCVLAVINMQHLPVLSWQSEVRARNPLLAACLCACKHVPHVRWFGTCAQMLKLGHPVALEAVRGGSLAPGQSVDKF